MEKDENEPHPDYLKGFNEGYKIAEFMPELSTQLEKAVKELTSERSEGFKDGRSQYVMEQAKERYPSWLRDDSHIHENPTKDKSKDKGIEPTR